MKLHRLILATLFLASTPLLIAQGTYRQLAYPGATATEPVAITTSGDIVGFYNDANGNYFGFLFSCMSALVTVPPKVSLNPVLVRSILYMLLPPSRLSHISAATRLRITGRP
jgi:hypothetical protein